jgi:uncharacterized protein (DUF488 family)
MALTVWTVGHSTRSMEELVELLHAYDLELVADVRRFPGSRRLPHFAAAALEQRLGAERMSYLHIPALGGRRTGIVDSPNTGWRHSAFRGYADHIASEEFAAGLVDLLMLTEGLRTVVMCAELLWWRCHRRIIADVLVSLQVDVVHIRDATHAELHRLQAPARLVRGHLRYDGAGMA